jgi:uncharacterized protein (TIGR03790 family)
MGCGLPSNDMKKFACLLFVLTFLGPVASTPAAESGETVALVYNSYMPGSKDVADHYAARRHVPPDQVVGLKMSTNDAIGRDQYDDQVEKPIRQFLESQKLLVFEPDASGAMKLKESRIRYLVLCYGVPVRIGEEPKLVEPGAERMQQGLRRNEAAVDSELSLLPLGDPHRMLAGAVTNPFFRATNGAAFSPGRGVLMVTRLDGPSAAIARALVDKALQAESDGLWGRAYIDLRVLPDDATTKKGDLWMRACAEEAGGYGFDTVVDDKPQTFSEGFPMSQIALYAGWYDSHVSGPFKQPKVEFMPGAFAYHLHSYSAQRLRCANTNWVGPLLAGGAAATMGCTAEPYLEGTPNIAIFFARFLAGMSLGEAAYASQPVLSWQTTVVGDPLYRPFGKDPQLLHEYLTATHSPMLAWSHERIINLSLNHHVEPAKLVTYLQSVDLTPQSAVLTEKLGDLYLMQGLTNLAVEAWQSALKLTPTPLQAARLTFDIGDNLIASHREARALEAYDNYLKQYPAYPGALELYQKMAGLAKTLREPEEAARYEKEISRLNGPPSAAK